MNQEDIIRMAREAGILEPIDLLESNQWKQDTIRELERFAALVAAAAKAEEREACAKVAEDTNRMVLALLNVTSQPKHIAAAIRERLANAGARAVGDRAYDRYEGDNT